MRSFVYLSYFISRFGASANFDSGTYERFHQEVVVQPVGMDARREDGMYERLLTRVDSTTVLRTKLLEGMICHY